jgi:hypothetical protein
MSPIRMLSGRSAGVLAGTPALFVALLVCVLVCLIVPSLSWAQDDDVPVVTRTVAITDARVVQAPGRVLDRATVVVRDGLIEAVGRDADVPFDARVIEGDSLTVYAGFVDGLTHAGVDTPDASTEDVERPGDPPPARAGILPHRAVRPMLSPGDVSRLREAGFGVAHVVPEGQMLPGEGAIILLAGDTPDDMILADRASLFAQIEGARGSWPNVIYPSTPMAVISKMRDVVREARRRQMLEQAYADDPRGRQRPPSDAVHSAFFPVLDGEIPLAFYAEDALDTHRILALAEELDLPITLAGLADAFDTTDALRTAGVPLFLTLDLPEEPDDAPDAAAVDSTLKAVTPQGAGSFFETDARTLSHQDVGAETDRLRARQAQVREQYYSTAATLREAGLQFGFTTIDAKPGDVHDNLRRMIENGLSNEDALAALTTDGAALLGISSQVGTVERGKIANLVVTDGPLFSEDTAIRHVLVDGRVFDVEEAAEAAEVTGSVAAVVGTWEYEIESPQGALTGTITLDEDDGDLNGQISSPMGDEPADLDAISFDGSTLSFSFDGGQGGTVTVAVELDGETFDGSVSTEQYGSFPISGQRTATPE